MFSVAWFDLSVLVTSVAVVAVLGLGKLIWKGGTGFITTLQTTMDHMSGKLDKIDTSLQTQQSTLTALTTWQDHHERQDDERHRDVMDRLNKK